MTPGEAAAYVALNFDELFRALVVLGVLASMTAGVLTGWALSR